MTRRIAPKGLSLLEVTLAGAIVVSVIVIIMGILRETNKSASEGMAAQEIEERGRHTLDACKTELAYAKLVLSDFPANKSSVRYQLPSSSGAIVYGYTLNGTFHADWSAVLTFDSSSILREWQAGAVVGAVTTDVDVNHDMDNADVFAVGRLFKRVYDGTTNTATLQAEVALTDDILLAYGNLGGDVSGDGINDPLFDLLDGSGASTIASSATVKMVKVRLWHGQFGMDNRTFHLRNNSQTIHLRNPQ